MNENELRELATQSKENIVAYILANQEEKDKIFSYLKQKNKDLFIDVSFHFKNIKSNTGSTTSDIKEELRKMQGEKGLDEVELAKLITNPYQPRIEMSEDGIRELANSIEKDGLQSAIKVTPTNDGKYIIVYGHRRVEAHRLLNKEKIKCIIEANIDKTKLRRLALIENMQREDLSLIEKALSYKEAMTDENLSTQRELSEELGIREARISEILSLLKLDEKIIADLSANKNIKDVTALSLLNRVPAERQVEVYMMLKNGEIDRDGIRNLINIKPVAKTSQCETSFKSNKMQLVYKSNLTNKKDLKAFQDDMKKLTEVFIAKLKERELEFLNKKE